MRGLAVVLGILLVMGVAGCNVSKPYVTKVDRDDQNMAIGNRGYVKGTPPPAEDRTGLKRSIINVDIEFPKLGQDKPVGEGAGSSYPKERSEDIK